MKNYTQTSHNLMECGCVYFSKDGKIHRLDGPADDATKCIADLKHSSYFWIEDKNYTEKEYWGHPEVIRYENLQKLKKKLGV